MGLLYHSFRQLQFPFLVFYSFQHVSLPPTWSGLFLSVLFWGLLFKRFLFVSLFFKHSFSVMTFWGFLGGLMVKNPPANAGDSGDAGLIHESGRSPGEGNGNPLQCSCQETFHGQRSLAGFKSMGSQRVQHN